jgi:hypothetical protein
VNILNIYRTHEGPKYKTKELERGVLRKPLRPTLRDKGLEYRREGGTTC